MLIATTNAGKVREIQRALAGLRGPLTTLADHPGIPEPEETGRTFAENARLKADYYARATGLSTVAEDSGLEIDALGGRPGVESARYQGATYPDKFKNLYRELADRRRPWTARYVCALALVEPPPPDALGRRSAQVGETTLLYATEATVEGEIADRPQGKQGFGYDPIFFYPPYQTTLGNVSDEKKLAVSHRGKAFARLRHWLELRS
jgi:XTP/dITP diphosphohydrolase